MLITDQKAKMQLLSRVSELMPGGKANYPAVRQYPAIAVLIEQYGRFYMHGIVLVLIRDLCASLNLVRNMNEDQMIEAAGFLLDECGNFRLEDYLMMFAMIKRGDLVKILDRIDIQIIGQALEEYWRRRDAAGVRAQDARPEYRIPAGARLIGPGSVDKAVAAASDLLTAWRRQTEEELSAERSAEDEEFRRRRDREVAAFERLMLLPAFVERIMAGEQFTEAKDLQFYENHKEAIEQELKNRR